MFSIEFLNFLSSGLIYVQTHDTEIWSKLVSMAVLCTKVIQIAILYWESKTVHDQVYKSYFCFIQSLTSQGDLELFSTYELTPWLMEPGGSKPHSQGLFNNSYPEPNQPNSLH